MRTIDTHKVTADEALTIIAVDPASGHTGPVYGISGMTDIGQRSRMPEVRDAEALAQKALGELPSHGGALVVFQAGPIPEYGVNGLTIEALLAISADRLAYFQAGPFACEENGSALAHIQAAMDRLKARTRRRLAAGTEGSYKTDAPNADAIMPTETIDTENLRALFTSIDASGHTSVECDYTIEIPELQGDLAKRLLLSSGAIKMPVLGTGPAHIRLKDKPQGNAREIVAELKRLSTFTVIVYEGMPSRHVRRTTYSCNFAGAETSRAWENRTTLTSITVLMQAGEISHTVVEDGKP